MKIAKNITQSFKNSLTWVLRFYTLGSTLLSEHDMKKAITLDLAPTFHIISNSNQTSYLQSPKDLVYCAHVMNFFLYTFSLGVLAINDSGPTILFLKPMMYISMLDNNTATKSSS